MVTNLCSFSPTFVYLYFLKYDKNQPFGIIQNFAFEILVGISVKVASLYLPWKTNCYLCVCSLEYMIC